MGKPLAAREKNRFLTVAALLLESVSIMHYRRIACFLLGLWLGAGLLMAWFGAVSFRTVDQMLSRPNPVLAVQMRALGPAGARILLRYQVAEQNRRLFEAWEIAQIILGVLFFSFLLFGSQEGKFSLIVLLLMLVATVVQRLAITPEMTALGRILDYAHSEMPSVERSKFWMLHSAYGGVEILKLGLGLILGGLVLLRHSSGDSGHEFDLIDKANHRHVNR
jgi:hypothetical protein